MRSLLIGLLGTTGLLALLGMLASIGGLYGAMEEFQREPEDLYALIFWACISITVFGYCATGIVYGVSGSRASIGVLWYATSSLIFILGFVMVLGAALSPLDRFLVIPGILVMLCPAAYSGVGRAHNAARQDRSL